MKTSKFFFFAIVTSVMFIACNEDESLMVNEPSMATVQTENVASSESTVMQKAKAPEYSSPFGWCTAGVRLLKGGRSDGKTVWGGVNWGGNACDWLKNAKSKGFKTGTTPKVGAIVVWPSNNVSSGGHVGVVTYCDSKGNWYYKAMNDTAGFGKYSERQITAYPNSKYKVKPIGYIYSW